MFKPLTRLVFLALFTALFAGCGGGGGSDAGSITTAAYTVTYDGNGSTGGSVPADTNNYATGNAVTVLGNTGSLVKTGFSFSGWNTQADGNGTTYTPAQTFAMGSANATLYAKWTANPTYTVTYNGNGNTGGTTPTDAVQYEAGQLVSVLDNSGSLVKTGFSFSGWNTQADGTGTTYTQGQTFAIGAANVTLYAKWSANPTYTVNYHGNGHTGGTVPVDATHYEQGQMVTVLANSGNLVNTGYTFAGWNTRADGTGTTYTQGQTFAVGAANLTLYAKWAVNPTYTVTYDGNGNTSGTIPSDTTHYEGGQTVTVLGNIGNLVKTGYSFTGWNTQANGSGTTYTQAQTFAMAAANITLYAKWVLSVCGDSVVDAGEQCDGGGANTASCDSNCTFAACGDAFVNAASGESCDDGNTANGDGCSATCVTELPSCSDGVQNGNETGIDCGGSCPACANTCAGAADGTACDDGNACTAGDSCQSGLCSSGVIAADGAACDDGDGCTVNDYCQSGLCMSGAGLACDDGISCTSDVCQTISSTEVVCTFTQDETMCDDGNECTADACDPSADCMHAAVPIGASCSVGFCDGAGACLTDADGDGFALSSDCDDANASVNPGATEICDTLDNDCDGVVNENLTCP